jgi:hypothetical protein
MQTIREALLTIQTKKSQQIDSMADSEIGNSIESRTTLTRESVGNRRKKLD